MKKITALLLVLSFLSTPVLAQGECERVSDFPSSAQLLSVWGQNAEDYYVVGSIETAANDADPVIYHYADGGWIKELQDPNSTEWGFQDIVGADIAGEVVAYHAVTWDEIYERTPAGVWQKKEFFGGSNGGMYAAAPNAIFLTKALNQSYSHYFFDGNAWLYQDTPLQRWELQHDPWMWDVWGVSEDFWVAVGQRELVVLYDGVLPFGHDDAVRHEDIRADGNSSAELFGVWGSGKTDIYVVGTDDENNDNYGVVFHYDGAAWTEERLTSTGALFGIWGNAPNNVYVVGGEQIGWLPFGQNLNEPAMFHYDGEGWNEVTIPAGISGLYDVWGTPGGDAVFAVGANGTIIKCSSPLGFEFTTSDRSRQDYLKGVVQNLRLNNPSRLDIDAVTGDGIADTDFVGDVELTVIHPVHGTIPSYPTNLEIEESSGGDIGSDNFLVRRPGENLVLFATAADRSGGSTQFDVNTWYTFEVSSSKSTLSPGEETTIEVKIRSEDGNLVNQNGDEAERPPGSGFTWHRNELVTDVGLRENAGLGTFSMTSVPINLDTGGSFSFTYTAPPNNQNQGQNSVRIQVYDQYAVEDGVQETLAIPLTGYSSGGGTTTVTQRYPQIASGTGDDTVGSVVPGTDGSGKTSGAEPVYATGTFVGPASFGSTTLQGSADYDAFIARYDAAGGLEWVTEVTSPSRMYLRDAVPAHEGGILVTGSAAGTFTAGGTTYTMPGDKDGAWIARVTPDGQIAAVTTVTSDNFVRVNDLAPQPVRGGYFLSGQFQTNYRVGEGSVIWGAAANPNGFLAFVDNDLNLLSRTEFTEIVRSGSSFARGVDFDSGLNRYYLGHFEGEKILLAQWIRSNGGNDAYLMRVNHTGAIDWMTSFGGPGDDQAYAMAVDAQDILWVAGTTDGVFDFEGSSQVGTPGGWSAFVLGFDGQPTPRYAHTWPGTDFYVLDMDANDEGGLCVAGFYKDQITLGSITLTASSPGNREAFAAHLGPDGSVNWATSMGGPGDDRANAVTAIGEADCLVGGQYEETATIGGSVYQSAGMSDAFMVRLNGPTTSVSVETPPEAPASLDFTLYPNPATDRIVAEYETARAGDVQVSLFDILGREVRARVDTNVPPGSRQTTVEVKGLAPGVYFCRLVTPDGRQTRPVVIYH